MSWWRKGCRQTNGHETGGKRVDTKHSKCVCSTGWQQDGEENGFLKRPGWVDTTCFKTGENILVADLNEDVSQGNIGDEEVMGRYGTGTRNKEGSIVVDFAKTMDLEVVNTYFKKKDEHWVTYKSGGKSTQVDY